MYMWWNSFPDLGLLYSAYTIDHAPTDVGGARKISSQRTRARATRGYTILITYPKILTSFNEA